MRCLFVLRELPRPTISVADAFNGREALSGTHTSGLLVAEGLARRGHAIGVCILAGQELVDCTFQPFSDLADASRWIGTGRVIWLSYGDDVILERLRSEHLSPTIWTQLPISRTERAWLEDGSISGLLTVSDTCRIPLMHSRRRALLGRVYNPLAPVFTEEAPVSPDRYDRHSVAYAGAAGPTKGLHRLLETWRYARQLDESAKLLVAGTGRLYGSTRELGKFGIASPEFEARFVAPIARDFGSLTAAGIEIVGLLQPTELRDLYRGASLGVVNMNWNEFTETFCCAATEMLATALPVFSVARGALPETIGRSGGAFLTTHRSPRKAAADLVSLLRDARKLSSLGLSGRQYVREQYGLDHILDQWTDLLSQGSDLERLAGPWRGPRSIHYLAALAAGRVGMPELVDGPSRMLRKVKAFRAAKNVTVP